MADYVTVADLLARKDVRTIARLVSDTGAPVSEGAVLTDAFVIAALDDAEGEVVSHLLHGGRYTPADLAALTGTTLALLKRIVIEIAMVHLLRRRPDLNREVLDAAETTRRAYLKDLVDGKTLFGGNDEDIAASRPTVDGMTGYDLRRLNSVVHKPRYFPEYPLPEGRR